MTINWDVIEGSGVRDTIRGLDIVRVCLVQDVPNPCEDSMSPSVLLSALLAPGMPPLYSPHPDPLYANALLEERNPSNVGSPTDVRVELVYRQKIIDPQGHSNPDAWTLTDAAVTSHVITYHALAGEDACLVWYKSGAPNQNFPPPKSALKFAPVHKIKSYRVIKASAILLKADWDSWKSSVRAAQDFINSDAWGTAGRGTWLFLGPTVTYFDISRKTVKVELTFMEDPDGHFPLIAYLNARGEHPANCISEAQLRAQQRGANHLPLKGHIDARNGLTIVSIYDETKFSELFAFTPDN